MTETQPKTSGSTRERLVEAATSLMWTYGIGEVSVDHILEKAGAKRGSFYHFFKSKADIIIECLDGLWRSESLELTRLYESASTPEEGLLAHIDRIMNTQVEARERLGFVPGTFNMTMPNSLLREDDRITGKLRELIDSNRRHMEFALERIAARHGLDRPVSETARILGYGIIGAILAARMENSLVPLTDAHSILGQAIGKLPSLKGPNKQSAVKKTVDPSA
jgi:TetR/AcrR family transcriptional repressor of nem operon